MYITFLVLITLIILILLVSFVCFLMAFYVLPSKKIPKEEFELPPGRIYLPYRETMLKWMMEVKQMPYEQFSTVSFDGLTLYGKYYECNKNAPIEIMFHGYRGSAQRDLCGGVQRAFSLGRNVLLVDQRGAGLSGGNVISFGINESRDCLSWIDFIIDKFGKDVKIILTGISMGAATVSIAAGYDLPENVVGVLADCGYTSAKDIIKKVIKEMKLPADTLYPFVYLGARIFGRFDLEKTSPVESLEKCKIPVIFFHGDDDRYVPHYMSVENFEVCTCPKRMVSVKDAGHGMAYLVDPDSYLENLADFFTENNVPTVDEIMSK